MNVMEQNEITAEASANILENILTSTDNIFSIVIGRFKFNEIKVPHSTLSTELPKSSSLPKISLEEVSNHDHLSDCWIVLYDRVYDVTSLLATHPGGEDIILDYAGRDATFAFRGAGHSKHILNLLKDHVVGELPNVEKLFRRGSQGGLKLSDMPDYLD